MRIFFVINAFDPTGGGEVVVRGLAAVSCLGIVMSDAD